MNNWEYMTQLSFLSKTASQRSTLTNVSLETTQETLNPEYPEDIYLELNNTNDLNSDEIHTPQYPTVSIYQMTY